jgi:hypothetical protein
VNIDASAAGIEQVHRVPPSRTAGRMPVRKESNVRACRTKPAATMCCAQQHPGPTDVQTHGTKETSTLIPAVGAECTGFSCWRCAQSA